MGDCCIGEGEEYNYLGFTMEGGKHGGFKSMGDQMKEANGLKGIEKYAAERSGSKYVIGRMENNDCKQADVWVWSSGMVPM